MQKIAVFDVGNVLIRWDQRNLYRKLFDKAEMEFFLTEVCSNAWNLEQERGRSWSEAEAEAIARHPKYAPQIRAFRARWSEMLAGAIEENVRILDELRGAGAPVYAITNFAADTFAEAGAMFPFLRGFTGVLCSGEDGVVKPDPAIFSLFLKRYGLSPDQCVFIDDSAANIAAAAKLGFGTIHYSLGLDARGAFQQAGIRLS